MKKYISQLCSSILEACLSILFPPFCIHCKKFGTYFCTNCYSLIYFYPFSPTLKLEKNYLYQLIVTGHFEPPLSTLIIAIKYQSISTLFPTLANLIWYSTFLPDADVVTFIPLHPQKQKIRGFNQTEILAKSLAVKLKAPCKNCLIKNTLHLAQAKTTSKEQRLSNVKGTFSIDESFVAWLKKLNRKISVLIVDDVITTGSTLNEAAKILKENGVDRVYGYAIAHD